MRLASRHGSRVVGFLGYVVLAVLVLTVLVFAVGSTFYTDVLWFSALGYLRVFWTRIVSRIVLGALAALVAFAFVYLNLSLTRRWVRAIERTLPLHEFPTFVTSGTLSLVFLAASALVALVAGASMSGYWMTAQRFFHGGPFGVADPIFNRDAGFYVFTLPFIRVLYGYAMTLIVVTTLACLAIYVATRAVAWTAGRLVATPVARYHLASLIAAGFVLKAAGYQLATYNLVYSPRGVAFGASYADLHAQLPALRVLTVVAAAAGVSMLVDVVRRGSKLIVASILTLLVASFVLGSAYPGLVQKLVVEPNEMAREKPYLEHNIRLTRYAYGLEGVVERDFPVQDDLVPADLARHPGTVLNVRLWDWRPLKQTYSQLQEIRLYYDFADVDVDRYRVGGAYRATMLSAREMASEQIPEQARTWINTHLKYTHGYGICMSPVNEVTSEGLPNFLIKDIPPKSAAGLEVTRPEIYYGERTDTYCIVNTRTQEFDYPMGDQNAYTTYQGTGGVKLAGLVRKLAFAVRFGTPKLLLSSDITGDSRMMFRRNVKDRVMQIAPFLDYDSDPYLVLADGRLYWMWDAYTVSDAFPYAEPYRGDLGFQTGPDAAAMGRTAALAGGTFNYVRNSVKVVVDAYNGTVTFYRSDAHGQPPDPVADAYSRIFPSLFRPGAEMPEALRRHVRYPEELFRVQATMFNAYHMKDPNVFYNKEDLWETPDEPYAGAQQTMKPYYTMMELPGENQAEFVMLLPSTPARKANMISWLVARCDPPRYGEMVVYKLPKQELVYGPMQIDARVNQDPEISKQLSLWNQRGSRVVKGNLIIVPIERSILYVQPVYLLAEQSELPELKRIAIAFGPRVVMQPTLSAALSELFGQTVGLPTGPVTGIPGAPGPSAPGPGERPPAGPAVPPSQARASELARQAARTYAELADRLKAGDWAGFGDQLRVLGKTLEDLQEALREGGS